MTKEGSTIIETFMSPGAGVLVLGRGHIHVSYLVKMHYYIIKCSFLLPVMDQTNQAYSNDGLGRATKIVNFMTPGAGVLVLGRGHISHKVKMHYFFKNLLLYSQA